ncbi:MAG: 1,6-anhydro-N-acetylmuramyl-L-alanine amidase AmpD [Alcanivoracaceae bacterium]|nr:1,6-anhydro-N-acetylmuramyl-L-alanine amidase AmpD [Alcanivoracaceae bacterium]
MTAVLTMREHWVEQARKVPSPNFGERPAGAGVSLLVIHNISLPPGEFGGPYIDAFFCNRLEPSDHPYFEEIAGMQVSSHFLIRRDGELVQYVACDKRAWHAGRSCWRDQEECNDFSVGIELEGTDHEAYTDAQYAVLVDLVTLLRAEYPEIAEDALTGHADIAPGRKTDPGEAFDWARLQHGLANAGEDLA